MEKNQLSQAEKKLIEKLKQKKSVDILRQFIKDECIEPTFILEDGKNLADLAQSIQYIQALELLAEFNVNPRTNIDSVAKFQLSGAEKKLIDKLTAKKSAEVLKDFIEDQDIDPSFALEDGSNLADLAKSLNHIQALSLLAQFKVFPREDDQEESSQEDKSEDEDFYSPLMKEVLEGEKGNHLFPSEMKQIMIECIDIGKPEIERLKKLQNPKFKKGFAILGGTGTGKSTFINYLNGCTMEAVKINGKKVIKVKPKSKGGQADSVTSIGHGKISMTFIPTFSILSDGSIYIDCPGLFDTRGAAISIGNAVNTRKILQTLDELCVIILINGSQIQRASLKYIKQVVEAISKLFGSKQNIIKNRHSILIGISRLNSKKTNDFQNFADLLDYLTGTPSEDTKKQKNKKSRNIVRQRSEQQKIFEALRDNIFTFDPLQDPMEGGLLLEDVLDKISQLEPIKNHKEIMVTSLTLEDKQKLSEIGREIQKMIDKALPTNKKLKLENFEQAAKALDYLKDLQVIGSQEINHLIDKAKGNIVRKMQIIVKEIESLCNAERFEEADELKNTLHQSMDVFLQCNFDEIIDFSELQKHKSILLQKKRLREQKERKLQEQMSQINSKLSEQKKQRKEQQQRYLSSIQQMAKDNAENQRIQIQAYNKREQQARNQHNRQIQQLKRIMKEKQQKAQEQIKLQVIRQSFRESLVVYSQEQKQRIRNLVGKEIKSTKLLYRASDNGFCIKKFHQNCDGVGNTLTLVWTQFNKKIGGFTPLKWGSSLHDRQWIQDDQSLSFVFSLTNNHKLTLHRRHQAIRSSKVLGPNFGFGWDLLIVDKANQQLCIADINYTYYSGYYQRGDKASWQRFCGNKEDRYFKAKEWQVWYLQLA